MVKFDLGGQFQGQMGDNWQKFAIVAENRKNNLAYGQGHSTFLFDRANIVVSRTIIVFLVI